MSIKGLCYTKGYQLFHIRYITVTGKFTWNSLPRKGRHPATSCLPNEPNGYRSLGQSNLA